MEYWLPASAGSRPITGLGLTKAIQAQLGHRSAQSTHVYVLVRRKTPWRDGTDHIALGPQELLEKLAALRVEMSRCPGPISPYGLSAYLEGG